MAGRSIRSGNASSFHDPSPWIACGETTASVGPMDGGGASERESKRKWESG